ncbi:MAG: immunoglobulin domain-containing protein [Verrucomicrobia bacterium]|nr:immunoglobulin domain-containing protein [Verrucomicrobiota bacterium]
MKENLFTLCVTLPVLKSKSIRFGFYLPAIGHHLSSLVNASAVWFLLCCVQGQAAAPANDNFASATEIVATNTEPASISLEGTTEGATIEQGENANAGLASVDRYGTVWYKITCGIRMAVHFSAKPLKVPLVAAVFSGTTVSNLTTVQFPSLGDVWDPEALYDAATGDFVAEPENTYWLSVMVSPSATEMADSFSLRLDFWPAGPKPPLNDNFADRLALIGTNVVVQGQNTNATVEAGERTPGNWSFVFIESTVWYSWTAPAGGVVYFSMTALDTRFAPVLGAYRGISLDSLVLLYPEADGGFSVEPGDTLQLQAGTLFDINNPSSRGKRAGPFAIAIKEIVRAPASSNDTFSNRLEMLSPTYHFEGSIYGATMEPAEPLQATNRQQTLWWKFVPPEDGTLRITLTAPFSASFAVYEGAQFTSIKKIEPGTGPVFLLLSGHEYSIQMASENVSSGSFSLDTLFRPMSNNMFVGSVHLEGTNLTYEGNLTFATTEPSEPPSEGANTVWGSWAAPSTGRVLFSLAAASHSQYVKVYTGPSLERLQPVRVVPLVNRRGSFLAMEGTVYHFQFSGAEGEFTFFLQHDSFVPAPNDDFANAELLKGEALFFEAKSVLGATMELGEPMHLGPVPQKSLWWKWQAPRTGQFYVNSLTSLAPDVTLALYQGTRVEALTLVNKAGRELYAQVLAGEIYYLATAVPADAVGDVLNYGADSHPFFADSRIIPGNLFRDPSWEATGGVSQYWHTSGSTGGYINEPGGADGTTWPVLSTLARMWQDIDTVPGHEYAIRFACQIGGNLSSCCGTASVRVLWNDQQLAPYSIPENETGFWHWADYTVSATSTNSEIVFENVYRGVELDAFSVVDLSAPPTIITQPLSASAYAGGGVSFIVGVNGSPPLTYQWLFNGTPLRDQTNQVLFIAATSAADAGDYTVSVTNHFGTASSSVASLAVEAPSEATILVQPRGDTVAVGGYLNLSVLAAGTPPLTYQWFQNGQALVGRTNQNLELVNMQFTNGGVYEVVVRNYAGSVSSLPAALVITNVDSQNGWIDFRNMRLWPGDTGSDAPIFDIDGVSRLNGSNYVVQLYAGPSVTALKPVGHPIPFRSGFGAGYFTSQLVAVPYVQAGETALAQVRVWEQTKGTSYEEARALGAKFGRSEILQITTGSDQALAQPLVGLTSFSLHAGLPRFNVGSIQLAERHADGAIIWSLQGEPGFRYAVEKSPRSDAKVWMPYIVLTNATGTIKFSDYSNSGEETGFYRARLLD